MATNLLDEIYTTYPTTIPFDPSQNLELCAESDGIRTNTGQSFFDPNQNIDPALLNTRSFQAIESSKPEEATPPQTQTLLPESAPVDPVAGQSTLPYPLQWGTPKWAQEPKIGLLERTIAPGHFAHLPPRDQTFKAESGSIVNSNGSSMKFAELHEEGTPQPRCVNCGTTTESINNWRHNGVEKAWICNKCGGFIIGLYFLLPYYYSC